MPGDTKRNIDRVSYAESASSAHDSESEYQLDDGSEGEQQGESDFHVEDEEAEEDGDDPDKESKGRKRKATGAKTKTASGGTKKAARGTPRETPSLGNWGPEQTSIMINKMAAVIMEHRKEVYTAEGLEKWKGNGGSAINQKIKQTLVKTWAPLGLGKLDAGSQPSTRKKAKVEGNGEGNKKGADGGRSDA